MFGKTTPLNKSFASLLYLLLLGFIFGPFCNEHNICFKKSIKPFLSHAKWQKKLFRIQQQTSVRYQGESKRMRMLWQKFARCMSDSKEYIHRTCAKSLATTKHGIILYYIHNQKRLHLFWHYIYKKCCQKTFFANADHPFTHLSCKSQQNTDQPNTDQCSCLCHTPQWCNIVVEK